MAEQHLIRWSPFDGMGRVSKDGHHIATFVTFADATRAVRGRAGCRSCKDPVRQRAEANQGGRDPSAAARPSTAKGSCKKRHLTRVSAVGMRWDGRRRRAQPRVGPRSRRLDSVRAAARALGCAPAPCAGRWALAS